MLKRQKGQAFILVLILLAVGALLITPALNLAFTGLKSRMIHHADLMEQYAADGAQDYSLWRLANEPGFAASLVPGVEAGPFYIILNKIKAEYTVTAQAAGGAPNNAPLTTDRYKITAEVAPDYLPVPGVATEFTYTITLKYMYPDVPTEALTRLVVNFPKKFDYVPGSTTGFTTLTPSQPGSTFRWDFNPGISFYYWEEKSMSFRASTTFPQQGTYTTEVDVRTDVPRGSTGPTAPIVVGNPSETGILRLKVTKTVAPQVIPPGVPTLVTYTISLENLSSKDPMQVQWVEDALPAGFAYAGADSGFLLLDTNGPDGTYVASGTRELWQWTFTPIGLLTINAGQIVTATFQTIATVDSPGTYANEVWVKAPGTTQEYSWPTSGVIVPQYDISTQAGGTTLKVVAQVSRGSHVIKSWQVE